MDHMERALELGQRVLGKVSPNPAVGVVVVRDEVVVGEGSTQPPGGSHAEVMALNDTSAYSRVVSASASAALLTATTASVSLRLMLARQ